MAKIFVSYSRKDSTTARKIIQALKKAGSGNPIILARRVLESEHVLIAGPGAIGYRS